MTWKADPDTPLLIAFLGKGGVGKTVFSAIWGKILIEQKKRVLFIDADPAMGLCAALGSGRVSTIGEARERIILEAKFAKTREEKDNLSDSMDYMLTETLQEGKGFGLLAMGRTDTLGCYCPLNTLLRKTIRNLAHAYDVVLIDAEAGLEQVNRQVTEGVGYPVIVSDNTQRSIATAIAIHETILRIPSMHPECISVVFNRVDAADQGLENHVKLAGIKNLGRVKPDPLVSDFDRRGQSLLDLPDDAVSVQDIKEVMDFSGFFEPFDDEPGKNKG